MIDDAVYSNRPFRRLGVVTGPGPGSVDRFCSLLGARYAWLSGRAYPDVLVHSVGVPPAFADALVTGSFTHAEERAFAQLLDESCRALQLAGADFIAIPSNTVACRCRVRSPALVDIVAATCEQVRELDARRVGLLGSPTALAATAYETALPGVNVVTIGGQDQEALSRLIQLRRYSPNEHDDHGEFASIAAELSGEVDAVWCWPRRPCRESSLLISSASR